MSVLLPLQLDQARAVIHRRASWHWVASRLGGASTLTGWTSPSPDRRARQAGGYAGVSTANRDSSGGRARAATDHTAPFMGRTGDGCGSTAGGGRCAV